MRWQAPSERVQMILLSPVIIPCVAILYPMVALIAGWRKFYQLIAPSRDWHAWFAWRPVQHYNDVDWIWLERAERRWAGFGIGCIYRFAPTPNHPASADPSTTRVTEDARVNTGRTA